MRTTAVCTTMARTQLEMLAIFWCFNLTRGIKVFKITKPTLTLTYTNCQLVSNRETGHKSMMVNRLRNRNNLISDLEVRKIARFVARR